MKYISDLEKYCVVYALPIKSRKHARIRSLFSRYPYSTMLRYYSAECQEWINDFIHNNNFQVVQVESLSMSDYVRNIKDIPKIYDAHNIESDILYRILINNINYKSLIDLIDYIKNVDYEKNAIRHFEACLSVSENDSIKLRNMGAKKLMSLPNCADLDYFYPVARKDFTPQIIFTGLMSWYPNIDAIENFCKKAYPVIKDKVPDIKFVVAGRNPRKNIIRFDRKKDIFVTGEIPDIRPLIADSDVCIVPLRIGGGTRLKILEYFAMEKPVVSTSIGAEGIDAVDGEHLIIEDDIRKFPDRIIELLNDPAYAGEIARNGRKLVERKYSWSMYREKLDHLYHELV